MAVFIKILKYLFKDNKFKSYLQNIANGHTIIINFIILID